MTADVSRFMAIWAGREGAGMRNRADFRPKVTHCVTLPCPSHFLSRGLHIQEFAAIIGPGEI